VGGLIGKLEHPLGAGGSISFSDGGDSMSWERFHDRARRVAASLQALGAGPGNVVAVCGSRARAFVTAIDAVWLSGSTLLVLPTPARGADPRSHAARCRHWAERFGAAVVLEDQSLGLDVGRSLDALLSDADTRTEGGYDRPGPDPARTAILQLTSGTTAEPRAAVITDGNVAAYLDAVTARLDPWPGRDRMVSWLPLSHDFGLIGGLLTSAAEGIHLFQATPDQFLEAPARWVRWMSDLRATQTIAPPFAYGIAGRFMAEDLDLSALRLAVSGGELIDPAVIEGFTSAGSCIGLDARSAIAGYGLAEATAAVTAPPPGSGCRVDLVDANVLERDGVAQPVGSDGRPAQKGRRLVRLGPALPGAGLRIVDREGVPVVDRVVGEIQVAGPTVSPGYDVATGARCRDGWLPTGDLGYLTDGELVACGRLRDLIIVNGRNIAPEEIERAAAMAPGVRAGNVAAFSITGAGTEQVVVAAESRAGDLAATRSAIARSVLAETGVAPASVTVVPPGTLPKTATRCRSGPGARSSAASARSAGPSVIVRYAREGGYFEQLRNESAVKTTERSVIHGRGSP